MARTCFESTEYNDVQSSSIPAIPGLSANIKEKNNQQEAPLGFDHSWEAQRFINTDSLVEDESNMGQIVALRERRDSPKSENKNEGYEGCGSADICDTTMHDCHQNATCSSAMSDREYNCTCNKGFSGNGTHCEEIIMKGCENGKSPCSKNAQCNYRMDSVECTCTENFYGDGMRCTELRSNYSSRKVYTKPGEPAVLVCSLNETIQWKKDGKIITNDGNIKIFQNLLVVNSVDDDDYGEYFCELQNYKGKGITMRLIMINDDANGDESTKFLIPFIVILILLVCLLIVTGYLLLRRRPKLATTIQRDPSARDNDYDNDKSSEISMKERLPSGETEEEKYNTLSNVREEEPFYQPLVDVKCEETSPQSMSEASRSNIYEEDAYDNIGAIKDENNHIYAEAK
ncbi:latent-transforming growth factor beta-binding 4-like isoform X1 [Paramuricea clavata]|uniref:Latent-transforming growth factor beta-binding 4-like isoform X1 n=1 Tax=Paramuricea clavata TaxID=317549 RepID=A0A6S7GTT8_PARCT|nr:latent-transforming growth factor beta-binding 4-like isoform X1 [Paramuricea clavata]